MKDLNPKTSLSDSKHLKIALIGNPNCGKSTLFNTLTGLNQKTGNFSGVTVDKHQGSFSWNNIQYTLIDLPGTYSLNPKTLDEKIAFDVLTNKQNEDYPDIVLFVADALNLKRSLFLLSQIIDLKIPIIAAINMADLLEEKTKIDYYKLSNLLGVNCVSISSINKQGIDDLKNNISTTKIASDFINIKELNLNFKDYSGGDNYLNWVVYQNNTGIEKFDNEEEIKNYRDTQTNEILARYKKINSILNDCIQHNPQQALNTTNKLDNILTHPVWGYAIFVIIMLFIFQSVFSLSSYPMDAIEWAFAEIGNKIGELLGSGFWSDLIVNGIIAGLSGILVFIPQIALLFLFISILEDTGYMARVSLLSDRILRVFGLNGKSVISLISGMACAVPAIMGTRTIKNWKERLITILITPLMSCSARLPVFALLISVAIPAKYFLGFISYQALTLLALYLLGFGMALIVAFILSKFIKTEESSTFMLELPIYRKPRINTIGLLILEKVKVFVTEAGKVIMIISLALWFLSSYGPGDKFKEIDAKYKTALTDNTQTDSLKVIISSEKLEASYAGVLGKTIEPIIKPLGYDWKIGIALITSFAAREVFVGTMATIYSVGDTENTDTLRDKILKEKNPDTGEQVFNRATGVSLILFYLFAMQCMSTIAIVQRETQSVKWPLIQFVFLSALAYLSALIAYQLLS